MDQALCLEIGGQPFFSNDTVVTEMAKAMCRRCPVTSECLKYALDDSDLVGVFGGTTEKERQSLRRRKRRAESRQAEGKRV